MRKEDFIPGKIYKADSSNLRYYYVSPNLIIPTQGIFQNVHSNLFYSLLYESYNYEWKEYKEPRKGTRWMNVYSSPRGDIYTTTYETKESANKLKTMQKIACIEVPWVEGQGL